MRPATFATTAASLLALTQARPASIKPRAGNFPFFNGTIQINQSGTPLDSLDGQYLTAPFTGANDQQFGLVLSVTDDASAASDFQQAYDGSYINIPSPGSDGADGYFMNLPLVQPQYSSNVSAAQFAAAPPGFYSVGMSYDVTQTSGFGIGYYDDKYTQGYLTYTGNVTQFASFALCNIKSGPSGNETTPRILWRSSNAERDTTGACADVLIDVTFEE